MDYASIDLEEMNEREIRNLLDDLQTRLEELNENEPKNMLSEEYDTWGEEHEELEDLIEEVSEYLEENF